MPSSSAPRPTRRLRPEQFGPAVKAATSAFPPGNAHGVFGVAIRRRRVRGRELPYWTLGLFVARKQDDPRARIEPIGFRHRGAAYAVIPDVVATGQPAGATRGHLPVFTGLHPGASIRVDAGHRCAGGAACLLTADGGPTHLLTAGHIFPPARGRFAVSAAGRPGGVEISIGRLWLNLLDGAERPMDVAVVELNPHGVRMALDSAARPRTPRLRANPFGSDFVDLARLKVFLPTTGDYHALRSAAIGPSSFHLSSDCRPPHAVVDVIVTDFANNTGGNSGTILMTDEREDDRASAAVGVAVGFAGAASLHEPIDRALRLIRAASGQAFKIWTPGG
jgi:hypothetical protein